MSDVCDVVQIYYLACLLKGTNGGRINYRYMQRWAALLVCLVDLQYISHNMFICYFQAKALVIVYAVT